MGRGLEETSRVCSEVRDESGVRVVRALWEMCRSVRWGKEVLERWDREGEVRRLDWMERRVRLERWERFCCVVVEFEVSLRCVVDDLGYCVCG